jgi:hypothetical protein
MRHLYITIVLLGALSLKGQAQEGVKEVEKYVGFNINPIMSQFVPFSTIDARPLEGALIRRTYKGNRAFKRTYQLDFSDIDNPSMLLALGVEKRKAITPKFWYLSSLEGAFMIVQEQQAFFSSPVKVGLLNHWGVEYRIHPKISFSTTAILGLLLDAEFGEPFFYIRPPLNISAHVRIN